MYSRNLQPLASDMLKVCKNMTTEMLKPRIKENGLQKMPSARFTHSEKYKIKCGIYL